MESIEPQPEMITAPHQGGMQLDSQTILMLTSSNDVLYQLELDLKNLYPDTKSGELTPIGEPLLNDIGVNSVLCQVRSLFNKNTVISNLKDNEIRFTILLFADNLIKDLMMNRVPYGIKSRSARDTILNNSCNFAYICLKRSLGEGERRFLKGSMQDIRTTVVSNREKKGLFSGFMNWGKN